VLTGTIQYLNEVLKSKIWSTAVLAAVKLIQMWLFSLLPVFSCTNYLETDSIDVIYQLLLSLSTDHAEDLHLCNELVLLHFQEVLVHLLVTIIPPSPILFHTNHILDQEAN
jgi:hypothetical protein